MEYKFKVGDRVKRVRGGNHGGINVGDIATVTLIKNNGVCLGCSVYTHDPINLELIEEYQVTTQSIKTMAKTLTEKFKLAMTSEPKKTFIKKGICNPDGSFTPEGRELFEQYQLTKLGDDFKKDVVDLITEDDK